MGSLLDLKGLTEPAKVLIERVSDAVGGLARPWQIERVARAEGRADLIRAEAKIAVSDVERRALRRLVQEEGRKQENIETITEQATAKLKEDSKPQDVDADWLTTFFERCRNISDDEMQSIWANLLADEANDPGTYHRKTIDLLATLSRVDAQLFSKLALVTATVNTRDALLMYNFTSLYPEKVGLDFEELCHLQDLGLINIHLSATYHLQWSGDTVIEVIYGKRSQVLKIPDGIFVTGKILFTRAGAQLMRLCDRTTNDEIFELWDAEWKLRGYVTDGHSPQELAT